MTKLGPSLLELEPGDGTEDAAGGGGGTDDKDKGGEKLLPQSEVDRIVQERLARDRKDRPSDEEIAALREKATKYEEIDAASKTELEKERERAERAEQAARDATERANKQLVKAAVLTAAGGAKAAIKPEHLMNLIDLDGVTVGDDGRVTGAEDAVKAFLDANPEYVGKSNGTGGMNGAAADLGARGGGKDQLASTEGMSSDEIAAAVADGRLDSYLQSSNK